MSTWQDKISVTRGQTTIAFVKGEVEKRVNGKTTHPIYEPSDKEDLKNVLNFLGQTQVEKIIRRAFRELAIDITKDNVNDAGEIDVAEFVKDMTTLEQASKRTSEMGTWRALRAEKEGIATKMVDETTPVTELPRLAARMREIGKLLKPLDEAIAAKRKAKKESKA